MVDEAEAAIVREAFSRYLALGSLPALQRELRQQGVVTRTRATSAGGTRGGVALSNGPLGYVLCNRVYLGELNHKGQSFLGEHEAIIAPELFAAVQARLDANRTVKQSRRQHGDALLTGLLFDDRNNRMSPSYAVKKGLRYHYYVSTALVQGRTAEAGSVPRVAVDVIEAEIVKALASAIPDLPEPVTPDAIADTVDTITIGAGRITIGLKPSAVNASTPNPLVIPWSPPSRSRKREIIATTDSSTTRPIRSEARSRLLAGIAKARLWLDAIMRGRSTPP